MIEVAIKLTDISIGDGFIRYRENPNDDHCIRQYDRGEFIEFVIYEETSSRGVWELDAFDSVGTAAIALANINRNRIKP